MSAQTAISDVEVRRFLANMGVSEHVKAMTAYSGMITAALLFFEHNPALDFGPSCLIAYGYSRQRFYNYFGGREELLLLVASLLDELGARNENHHDIIMLARNTIRHMDKDKTRYKFFLKYKQGFTS
ncbi:MAG TPA: hypothetical protein VGL07_16835 [Buttiauxella sp.]